MANMTATTVASSTSTTAAAAAPPEFVAVVSRGQELVLVDSNSGRRKRPLAKTAVSEQIGRATVSSDTVYYGVARMDDSGWMGIRSVPVAGGAVRDVVEGRDPAISLDGSSLAFVPPEVATLAVRDVRTGTERRWAAGPNFARENVSTPAWVSANKITFVASYSEGVSEIFVLDLASARSLDGAKRLGPPPGARDGTGWHSPDLRNYDDLLGVIESCCSLDQNNSPRLPSSFLVVDPVTGEIRGRLDTKRALRSAVYETSGRHQLIIDTAGTLYRRSGGGLSPVGRGYVAADW